MSECTTCEGTGEATCIQCYGSGKNGADPNEPCSYCDGTGKTTCYDCGGSGEADS